MDPTLNDNIFHGLKVVDLASFIAGPSAAVILSDFGADVIKVEPPSGDLWRHAHQVPPQPQAKDPYPWHLANRNKRGMTLDLKSAGAPPVLQENGPERPDFKIKLFADMDAVTPPDSLIASSSSSLTMSLVQSQCRHPERCVIGHPFNPPHVIPLVEVVGGAKTSPAAVQQAMAFYKSIGKRAILLRKEVPGHVANRLQAALYREVLYLIEQGVLSVADADDAVSWGPGLHWGVMSPSLQFHLGGGAGGIQHFIEHLLPVMSSGLWKTLGSPAVTPELKLTLTDGVLQEAGKRSVAQLAAAENEVLLGLLSLRAKHG
jgi:carnitine 3-dehydrogenase